jgi:hypothetical protein
MNLIQVTQEFATEEQCLEFLAANRWPDGVRCPICGNNEVKKIVRKTLTENKRPFTFACLEPTCKHRFSPTVGTIFHGSHIPLRTWFMAITIVMDAKKGMSARQIQEHLDIGSYRTAWYMVHRIRKAMVDDVQTKLTGTVMVDELFIGGKSKRRGVTRPRSRFDTVLGMIEKGGRLRYFHTPDLRAKTLKPLIDRHISSNARHIVTDSAMVYPFALDDTFKPKHRTVNHTVEWVSPEGFTTNAIESAFSLLRRGMIGSFHRVSIKHLHRYLAEFETRFNMRKDVERFEKIVRRMLKTDTMKYKQLIADPTPTEA